MFLSTHAGVGAAIGSLLPSHPVAAAVLGFASHFPLDAIPHWDYPIGSGFVSPAVGGRLKSDRALTLDALTIDADALLGVVGGAVLFASPEGMGAVLLAACRPSSQIRSSSLMPISRASHCTVFSAFIAGCTRKNASEDRSYGRSFRSWRSRSRSLRLRRQRITTLWRRSSDGAGPGVSFSRFRHSRVIDRQLNCPSPSGHRKPPLRESMMRVQNRATGVNPQHI